MRGPSRGVKRVAAHQRGLRAERLAGLILILKGYRIIARRYAAAGGEIDIIAQRGKTVIFVEVKARAALDDARIAITSTKERRIVGAIRHWLARNNWAMPMTLRCDAIFVGQRRFPQHVPNVMTLYLD
ncbi:YraN family protein [Pseudochelatococcus sp. G4_1912]|jgi:putative endonuclease|uniref:YraN family protein n=1 Tax=Pseudochelatococcus sp. G4_1912 TaxID=3114288 RepID=UPI0039C670F8